MKKVKESVSRKAILKRIKECLHLVEQWQEYSDWARCHEYSAQAAALIELLEIDDCGSVGGFDEARGQKSGGCLTLEERFDWLRILESKGKQ